MKITAEHTDALKQLLYRIIIALAVFFFVSSLMAKSEPLHLQIARQYVGITERGGNNRGPEVKKFLASVGLNQGYAWCAAFTSFCLTEADVEYPTKRSAGARNFISNRSVRAVDVMRGKAKVEPGWLLIWGKGNSWSGHIGFVTSWGKVSGKTIEGNTSSGRAGSQRDGDGVYTRNRSIQPGNYFRITHFEPVVSKPEPKPVTLKDMGGSMPAVATGVEVVR